MYKIAKFTKLLHGEGYQLHSLVSENDKYLGNINYQI